MKIIVTTSNKYLHILPTFCFLFNKYWSDKQPVEIVGYDKPEFSLPGNFTFHSLGKQIGGAENFGTDLRAYFEKQDDWFIWMMEDTFLRESINIDILYALKSWAINCTRNRIGKINLTTEFTKRPTHIYDVDDPMGKYEIRACEDETQYRLSTQPAIWNKMFLLQYLKPNLTPWKFETQNPTNDGWDIIGATLNAISHNEGVRKNNLFAYDLKHIPTETLLEMVDAGILTYEQINPYSNT